VEYNAYPAKQWKSIMSMLMEKRNCYARAQGNLDANKQERMMRANFIPALCWDWPILPGKIALVSIFFKPMSAEQKAVYDARQSAKYAEERLQREERKQQQLARATGSGRPVKRPMLLAPEDLDKK
jgi:hypothetical protein